MGAPRLRRRVLSARRGTVEARPCHRSPRDAGGHGDPEPGLETARYRMKALLALVLLLMTAAPVNASIGPGDGVPTNPEDLLPAGRFIGACEGRKYAAVFDNRD